MFRKIDYLPIVHALRFSSMHYHQCKVYASFLFPTNDVSRSMLRTEKVFCVAAAAAVSAGPFFSNFNSIRFFSSDFFNAKFLQRPCCDKISQCRPFSLRVSLRPGNFANLIIFVSFLLLCSVKKRLHLINHSPPHVRTKF